MIETKDLHIDKIIERRMFHHACQPLYDLQNWRVIGYEILIRCEFFESPEQLFECAIKGNRLFELDISSMLHALTMQEKYISIRNTKWFLNVYPSTLIHPSFQNFLDQISNLSLPVNNLVFEINETEKIPNMDSLKNVVTLLRTNFGYRLAIDDVGKGESALRSIAELDPDYLKLDKYFSVNLSTSAAKQRIVKMLVRFCQENKIHLVLEGIEEPEDLAIAKELGVHLGQGYLLGKPSPISNLFNK